MLDFDKDELCIGCTACYAICPKHTIKMVQSSNGFYIPEIVEEYCVKCGACERICPAISKKEKDTERLKELECLHTYSLNSENQARSSSGGVFFELAYQILKENGIVCGCIWDENFIAKHVCTDDVEIVKKMQGSKYVQSNLDNCFIEIKKYIQNRKVLFVGTPCQVEALNCFIGESDNLITCALICGGVPSPEVWLLYKNSLEQQMKSKVIHVNMRSKINNWLVSVIEINFENGKSIKEILMKNIYGANYVKGLTLCKACFNCEFKLDTLKSDIIIGDHWGLTYKELKLCNNMGMSTVIPLSKKGQKIVSEISSNMYFTYGNIDGILKYNPPLMHKHEYNPSRKEFFEFLQKKDIKKNLEEHMPKSSHSIVRKILFKTRLFIPVYTIIWKIRKRRNK